MLLKQNKLYERIERAKKKKKIDNPLVISPRASLGDISEDGAVAVDLRLGTWFSSLKKNSCKFAGIDAQDTDKIPSEMHYISFKDRYILHPHDFVLGITLEWLRIPNDLGGYVNGKSSWGRRGLIIATAAVVHPGYKGCLTLEITNVGEIPVELKPGMKICQLSLHTTEPYTDEIDTGDIIDKSSFVGMRKPALGKVKIDPFSDMLSGIKKS